MEVQGHANALNRLEQKKKEIRERSRKGKQINYEFFHLHP